MSVVNRNSGLVANIVAQPQVFNSPGTGAVGQRNSTVGRVASAADDSATSVFRFVRVPSNARIENLLVSCAQASSAGAMDFGVHETLENGGAAVDADFFATAQSLSAAALARQECAFEAGTYTYTKRCQPLWQALGLTRDPGRDFDITGTISTNFNGGPTEILAEVHFAS